MRTSMIRRVYSICRAVACMAMLTGLGACGDSRSLKWTEDVQLPDGRVVTLTRYQEFKGPNEIGQPPTESNYWFEFKHPDTGEIVRWESDRYLAIVALMIDEGTPRLLVAPKFNGFSLRKCPDPPYLLFRHSAGNWSEERLEVLKGRKVRANVTYGVFDAREQIRERDHRLTSDVVRRNAPSFLRGRDIDFRTLEAQTFGNWQKCVPPYSWMAEKSGDQ